jgi:NADPH:quinone reductase
MENRAVIFKSIPLGLPSKGEHLTVEAVLYPDAPDDGIVVQNVYGSLDPYLRGRMSCELNLPLIGKKKHF